MAKCWMTKDCAKDATVEMTAPDGFKAGRYCPEHATAARDEYAAKLGETWTVA